MEDVWRALREVNKCMLAIPCWFIKMAGFLKFAFYMKELSRAIFFLIGSETFLWACLPVCRLVGRLLVRHKFLKGWEIALPCSYIGALVLKMGTISSWFISSSFELYGNWLRFCRSQGGKVRESLLIIIHIRLYITLHHMLYIYQTYGSGDKV